MSLSSKRTATSSTTSNQSLTQYSDQSVNAGGDGSIALGEGATLSIQDVSTDIANEAIRTSGYVAGRSIDGANQLAAFSIDQSTDLSKSFISGAKDLVEMGYRESADVRNESRYMQENNAALASRLSQLAIDNVAESRRDPDNQLLIRLAQYGLYAFAGLVVLVLLFRKGGK